MRTVGAAIAGYLIGTIPTADLAARHASDGRIDLREWGSRNPGALNAITTLGPKHGVTVAVVDVAKGTAAGLLGKALAGDAGAHVGAVAAVTGHCYPIWNGFRGGKGIATSFGQCVATFPAFAPAELALGLTAAAYAPGNRPGVNATLLAAAPWVGAGIVWARFSLPNLWGPEPTAALPLANAATTAIVLARVLGAARKGHPDDLAFETHA